VIPRRLDPSRFDAAGRTDVGAVRQTNQDALGECAAGGLRAFVVADGMGGHAGGETASRITVETLQAVFAEAGGGVGERLRAALETANRRIHEEQLRDPRLSGMGTTGVALGFGPDGAFVANVGDSRAYRMRGGSLQQLTRDHSVVAELERRGYITAAQAAVHPRRNEVLRSLGTEESVEVDIDPVEVAPEDVFLLCSDGLSGVVPDAEIAALLVRQPAEDAARALVEAALAAGGPDNVTVQIVRAPAHAFEPPPAPALRARAVAIAVGAALLALIGWVLLR
jgi:protein phosphatase